MKTPVFVLFGPTASGKTALLERLFGPGGIFCASGGGAGKRAEVISADSMQVYRGMDIGTAKPSPEERARIPYHLIDIRNPDEQFNAGEFVRLAEAACLAAAGRGALPVVSGGTGFYLKNLVLGLPEAPPSDQGIRLALREELACRGAASLMEELARSDPVSAGRIHINDEYRLLRALEVYRLTGRPLSSYASPWSAKVSKEPLTELTEDTEENAGIAKSKCAQNSVYPASANQRFDVRGNFVFLLVGLRRSREELYRRINARTAAMFRAGLPGEVKRLFEAGYTPSDPGLKAIGYREFFVQNGAYLRSFGHLSEDIAGVEALVAQNSRRYAKRQLTFFASLPGVKWIDCGNDEETALELTRLLEEFL